MPNWVITRIYITGPEDKIKEFEDKVLDLSEDAKKTFSFHRILPTPEELVNTISPNPRSETVTMVNQKGELETAESYRMFVNEWEIKKAIAEGKTPPDPIPCNNATPEMCDNLLLKYGRTNWYDWQMYSWGTKWDACESIYNQEDKILEFQTAWNCPEKVIQKMVEMFPDLQFNGGFADEDFGSNTGSISGGDIYYHENLSEEAYETAATLWGYEGYYDDEKGEWVEEEEED